MKENKDESLWNKFIRWFKRNMTWVYFTIAIVFILFPNTIFSPLPDIGNIIMEKIGFVALTSGVFAGVLKSIQFSGLFKEELTKIISGTSFLNNRKDLPELWKKISKIIYSEKFPEISNLLEDRILTTYFPMDSNHYNQDVIISIVINSIDEDLVIDYTQTIQYSAILDSASNNSNIQYTQSITDDEDVDEKNELLAFEIDQENMITDDIRKTSKENGKKKYVYNVPISGKKKFDVLFKFHNQYSLKGQNYKLLRFVTITKNVDVTVSHPENIEVSFFNIGVINDFKPIHNDVKNLLSRRHREDLILPKQGFGLSFNKT